MQQAATHRLTFFANTYWTGVAATYGQTYQQPLCLHFNGDSTVTAYALFTWFIGNEAVTSDSVVGKITKIDTVRLFPTRTNAVFCGI